MNLTKGQRLTLEVVGDSYGYYTLNCFGRNVKVKKFDFQRYDKTPDRLSCIVDRADVNNVYLKQDMAPIFAARYKPGESYEFIVEADMTMTAMPHYRVTQEGVGYWVLLPAKRGLKLSHGDRVRCRVGRIQGINLNLHIEEVLDRHGEPPMVLVKPAELADHAGEEAFSGLMEAITEEPRMIKARQMLKERNPEWVLEALRAGRDYIFSSEHTPEATMVSTLRSVAAYILEDSVLLGAFPAQRRLALREELARLVSHCDDMLTALSIVADGRQGEYISDMMAKLSASGYLYRPESKLRTLMCVFSLDPDSIDAKMTELISIIHKGNVSSWLAEPFCSAFVEQLQLYIDSCHTILDNVSDIDGDDTESRLDKMLAAIAIQQILAAGRTPSSSSDTSDELVVNRSRLYRYFSFKGNCSKPQMLEKSFQVAVTGDIPDKEFTWDDTKDLSRLARKLLYTQPLDSSKYTFTAPNALLSVSADSIDLRIPDDDASHQVLPASLDLWHGLQIWLDEPLPMECRHPSTILQFRDTFAHVRKALRGVKDAASASQQSEKSKSKQKQKAIEVPERKERVRMLPDPGDIVDIVVEPYSPGEPGAERFSCRVVEEGFRGKGYLDRSNITRGNGAIPLRVFFDEKNRPYKLRARVMACSSVDDSLSFSILDELNRYINANVEPGTELNGVVTAVPTRDSGYNCDRFTVLTEHGYTAWVDGAEFADDMQNGDIITLRVDSVGWGARADIMATCISNYVPGERVTFEDAFATLIYSYADAQVYTGWHSTVLPSAETVDEVADSAGQMDEPLSETRVEELMLIIARLADLETDMVKAYNYFCFAGLLAELLDLEQQSQYYASRCSIIEVLDEFASNGRVDLARVDSLSSMIIGSSASSLEAQKLKLLAALDRPERTDKVWDVIRTTPSGQIEKLGRLILAYNALDGFKLGRERSAIREQIYNELHLVPDTLPEQIEGGHESQTVEFKTSLIYPAGNSMRRDIRRQTREILQIIAGFLNTSGGRLYIGVSDEGYVRGVATDMEFFKSADKMDLHLLNAVDKYLKMVDRFRYIQTSWQEYDGKSVYVIDVRPSHIPVALEGQYFQRHGTSTRFVPAELESRFLEMRRDIPIPSISSLSVHKEPADIVPAPVRVAERPAVVVEPEPAPVVSAPAPAPDHGASPEPAAPVPAPVEEELTVAESSSQIATSNRRDNRHYDTCNGTPFHEPVSFFYITDKDGSYRLSPDPLWIDEESLLTLRMREDEAEADLIAIFKSGHGLRLDYQRLDAQGRISGGELAFLTPARPTDGLFVYYLADDGRSVFKRYFPAESIRRGSDYEQGDRLLPADSTFLRAIIIEPERAASFARFERNGQRLSGGMADLEADYARTLTYHL